MESVAGPLSDTASSQISSVLACPRQRQTRRSLPCCLVKLGGVFVKAQKCKRGVLYAEGVPQQVGRPLQLPSFPTKKPLITTSGSFSFLVPLTSNHKSHPASPSTALRTPTRRPPTMSSPPLKDTEDNSPRSGTHRASPQRPLPALSTPKQSDTVVALLSASAKRRKLSQPSITTPASPYLQLPGAARSRPVLCVTPPETGSTASAYVRPPRLLPIQANALSTVQAAPSVSLAKHLPQV